jgi:ABC-2 type transport system permease protein
MSPKKLSERYRYSLILLRQIVKTDFKLRYQGSALGYLWSLLKPLMLFLILYVVFGKFVGTGAGMEHFASYLLLGVVLWYYFVEVTSGSIMAIVGKGDLIRKINFPKYVIVVAGSLSALINLFLNFVILALFLALDGVDIRPIIMLLPLIILELFVFSLALAFFLSAAYVRFRDINHIWEVLVQGAFYATPILYLVSFLPLRVAKILLLNPIAQIIQDARYVLVSSQTDTLGSLYHTQMIRLVPLGIVFVSIVIAAWYFRSRSRFFAEEV